MFAPACHELSLRDLLKSLSKKNDFFLPKGLFYSAAIDYFTSQTNSNKTNTNENRKKQ